MDANIRSYFYRETGVQSLIDIEVMGAKASQLARIY